MRFLGLWRIQRWARWWEAACKGARHHVSCHRCRAAASTASVCVLNTTVWWLPADFSSLSLLLYCKTAVKQSWYITSNWHRPMSQWSVEWEVSKGLDCHYRFWGSKSQMCCLSSHSQQRCSPVKHSFILPSVLPCRSSFCIDYDGSKISFSFSWEWK